MKLIDFFVKSPVKVSVGVLLVALFGVIAMMQMPFQLTPEVQTPTITIQTDWPGASPQEYEREIIDEQEEFLKSVGGLTKMSSSSYGSSGRIRLEFAVGTNMNEVLLEINSRLQQVPEYPEDADRPVITTSDAEERPIAWFMLGPKRPTADEFDAFIDRHPDFADEIEFVRETENGGLLMMRLRELAETNGAFEELIPDLDRDIIQMRRFVENNIESSFERVPGVAQADVHGGLEDEMQVIVDPHELAARGLTITDIRDKLRAQNADLPAGDIDEGKRAWIVRTLGRFETPEQVENQLLAVVNGAPVYVRDVAEVKLGYKDPDSLVRRFGRSGVGVSAIRENGANVLDVMVGLRKVQDDLNEGILATRGLQLTQVYDESGYIYNALDLVQSNIFVGGALTMIVLMTFLHLGLRTLIAIPLILGTALAAVYISPWFFALTLAIVIGTGFWFARGSLVVGLAIPISIIGTFLALALLGRSLNVISLAGLAFAVGMLVDNAVVVLENIYRRYDEFGESPATAAVRGTQEVWGAVVASTLTTIAVFLPVIFVQEEAGQLFRDIALAITAAIGFSLLVSVTVIPSASARLFHKREDDQTQGSNGAPARPTHNGHPHPNPVSTPAQTDAMHTNPGRVLGVLNTLGGLFISAIVGANRWIQGGVVRRLAVIGLLLGAAVGLSYTFWPAVEYLPTGNRNLVFGSLSPPAGYNFDQMMEMGTTLEEKMRPYWDLPPKSERLEHPEVPYISDYFYVVRGYRVFMGVRAEDPSRAAELVPIMREAGKDLPGTFVSANQSSLFGRGLSGGREIDIEISGPELTRLVEIGRQVMDGVNRVLPGAQARPNPDLDLSAPEIHVEPYLVRSAEMGVSSNDLGYTVDALVDGAITGDYYYDGEEIDLTIQGESGETLQTHQLEGLPVATPIGQVVPLGSLASVELGYGPEQIDHREAMRAVTIEVTPPPSMPMQQAMQLIQTGILADIRDSGALDGSYRIDLAGTADKLRQTWDALWFNLMLALLITYLLMAALFESWLYPFVIILSVPLGAVGGILGLEALNWYLTFLQSLGVTGIRLQQLDVLTMLGFVILIGTVVNNPILIVHQSLNHIREDGYGVRQAVLESTRSRVRPIFMTTTTTVLGLLPLVLFPGSGSELYRGLGAVVLGGLLVSTIVTLILVPSLFTLMLETKQAILGFFRRLVGSSQRPQPPIPQERPTPVGPPTKPAAVH